MNEIVEESQRLATYLAGIQKDKFGDTSLPLSTMVPRWFHDEVSSKRKKEKNILRLVNAAMSGLPAEIFTCDQCGGFCRRRLVIP